MGMEALASYIWLQQAFLSLFALWNWDFEVLESVKTGSVSYELLRPTDIYSMWMSRSIANRLARAALRMVPVILLASLLPAPWGLRLRISPAPSACSCCPWSSWCWWCAPTACSSTP